MQIALPIGTPLDKNLLSLGVFLLAGITVVPITTPEAVSSHVESKRYYDFFISMDNQSIHEQDFLPLMLNVMRRGTSNESEDEIKDNRTELKNEFPKTNVHQLTNKTLTSESYFQSITPNRGNQDMGLSERIVDSSKAWLGVPYRYGGVTVEGVDCSGLVQNVFKQNGVELPRTSQEQFRSGVGVPSSQLKLGDLVFFSTSGPGASHVGIYIGNQNFVSATREKVEIQSLDQEYWNRTYRGSRRVIP